MPRPQREPRTVLGYLIQQGNRTYEECAAEFPKYDVRAAISARHLGRLARGERTSVDPTPATRRALQAMFGLPFKDLLRPWTGSRELALLDQLAPEHQDDRDQDPPQAASPDVLTTRIARLRQGVDEVIGDNALSEASLGDWEQTAVRLAAATRFRSSGPLLAELASDFAELHTRLQRRQPLSSLRRLTVVTAQMAGLMSLTLLKLNENDESRNWARTARIAADEAGAPAIQAWVRAQEAYAHFYGGSLSAAMHVARQAQAVAGGRPCAGVALAAALEARAHAALGRAHDTRDALARARAALAGLREEETRPSAFGYDEAQLCFHEGNALTHLHDTEAAWRAQQRALDLYPTNDYMDRALIQLDRASCLAHDGDTTAAMAFATQTLLGLTEQQRGGLITLRGQQVLDALPTQQRGLPPAQEFRDVLMLTSGERIESP